MFECVNGPSREFAGDSGNSREGVFFLEGTSKSENVLMSSFMGLVVKISSEVYMANPGVSGSYNRKKWLDDLQKVSPSAQMEWYSGPAWYLNKYKSKFNGYILYDDSSINVATSPAGEFFPRVPCRGILL